MLLKKIEQYTVDKLSSPRNKEIKIMRDKGFSLQKIGSRFGISGERVRQILSPSIIKNRYIFECQICQNTQSAFVKTKTVCLNCLSKKRTARKKKLKVLEEIFKDLPKWKSKGRERTRAIVRYRDDYTCQTCGIKWKKGERSFDVHHLNGMCGKKSKGYDSVADIDGLITLCHKCHYNHPGHSQKQKKFST